MRYFIIAGEASGDLHASNLMRALKLQDSNAEFCFLGGDLMAKEGGVPIIHYREMAFMGIVNVVLHFSTIFSNLRRCKEQLLVANPDVVILVDYPSFNLRIAKFVKKNTNIPVYCYISPKIWAWKSYRIKAIKKYFDRLYCILPFEIDFYQKYNYTVDYVGNPTVDSINCFLNNQTPNNDFVTQNRIGKKPIVALLAGSRKQEIANCLPLMAQMATFFTDFQFVVAGAPGISAEFYDNYAKNLPVIFGETYELVKKSHVAIVNSGTATLETALLGTPQIVVYHVIGGRLASLLKRLVLHVRYVSLVNLIAGKEVVPELVAHLFTKDNLFRYLKELLYDEVARLEQQKGYEEVAKKLGSSGCSEKTAALIFNSLK